MPGSPTMRDYRLAQITVIRDAVNQRTYKGWSGHRMAIYSADGQFSFSFDIAPREIEFDGFALDWASIERVGSVPLLVPKAGKSRTIKLSTTLTHKTSMYHEQERTIDDFRRISRISDRVLVRYSRQELGAWHVTDASMKSELRDPESNSITRATIDMTLTEAGGDPNGQAGQSYALASVEQPTSAGRGTIDVQPGDTLQSLALRAYGNPGDWPWIYRLNQARMGTPWEPLGPIGFVYV